MCPLPAWGAGELCVEQPFLVDKSRRRAASCQLRQPEDVGTEELRDGFE